jgi:hypothetical protein
MRNDMTKIIFENGKRGSKEKISRKNRFHDKLNPEVFTKKLYEKRYNNLNYSIVKKFLKSRVNSNWDDVYSEYCMQCNSNNYLGFKSREIIKYYVHIDCKISENGDVVDSHNLRLLYRDFYVDPNTKLLQQKSTVIREKIKETPKLIKLSNQDYYIHNNIWYRVTLQPINRKLSENWYRQSWYFFSDQFGNYTYSDIIKNYKKDVIITFKEQASKKEIKLIKKYLEL